MNTGSTFLQCFEALRTLLNRYVVAGVSEAHSLHHAEPSVVSRRGFIRRLEAKAPPKHQAWRTAFSVYPSPFRRRVQRARLDERTRLARELHDGVLQSLTGATLQMQALRRLIDENPSDARDRLRCLEEFLIEEQSALRSWTQTLKPGAPSDAGPTVDLAGALKKLGCRMERQWSLRTVLRISDAKRIPAPLSNEVYRLVQEALNNVGRHAGARLAQVQLEVPGKHVHLVVCDDGRGFPFAGRYDLAALTSHNIGPVSFRERVASLRGELVLESTASGSRLDALLPLQTKSSRRSIRRTS